MRMQLKYDLVESIHLQHWLLSDEIFLNDVDAAAKRIKVCFKKNKKLLIAGNGGSAADAQHFAAEFVGHYKKNRNPLPALALSPDSCVTSAISNDYSYDDIFARQLQAFGQKGDLLICFSTSGNSKNIIKALETAKEMQIDTICFLGKDGGQAINLATIAILIPSDNTPRIQEIHTFLLHSITEKLEEDY
jgi:D-sedoheptulose 7-phosphate isomerase